MIPNDEITSLPENNLVNFNSKEFPLSGLAQVTGIGLKDKKLIEGREDVNSQGNVRKIVPDKYLPVIIDTEGRLLSLTGISQLIKELREHILKLSQLDDTNVKPNGAIDHNSLDVNQRQSELILSEKETIVNKYVFSVARIELLIEVIDSLSDNEKSHYNLIETQLNNWLKILKNILPNLDKDKKLNQLINAEIEKQRNNGDEVNRLKKLLSGERAESDIKKQDKLRKRVIKVLLGNTNVNKQKEVAEDLSAEIWEIASTINDIRLVERFKKEQINLLDIKNKISDIKKEFESTPKQDEESKEEVVKRFNNKILKLVIPIINTTNKIFPHNSGNSPTNIAAVLYRNEAVCAGKAAVISSIMRLIGLQSTTIEVIQTNSDKSNHEISKTNILGGKILFADANYRSRFNENPIIRQFAKRLVYTAQRIPNIDNPKSNVFKMMETSGEISFFESDSSNPHKIIANQEQRPINFDHYNYANLLESSYQELGLNKEEAMKLAQYHYLEALKVNPNSLNAHNNYANLLKNNYKELGLNKEEAMKQAQKHYLEALRINPNFLDAHYNYAILLEEYYKELGLSEQEAMRLKQDHYLKALEINSNCLDAHNNYANLLESSYQELGLNKEEAMKLEQYHYLEALRINPNYLNAHNNYANLLKNNYKELGLNKEEAMKQAQYHYLEALKDINNEHYVWIMTLYADFLHYFVENEKEALEYYKKVIELINTSPRLPNWLTKEEIKNRISDIQKFN